MINIIIISNNIEYAVDLFNFIQLKRKNIKICGIVKNKSELKSILDIQSGIDIYILDSNYDIKIKEKNLRNVLTINNHSNMLEVLKNLNLKINNIKNRKIIREKIIKEIIYLGYEISHKGTQFLVDTIEYIIIENIDDINSLEHNMYPTIAKKNNKTVHNITCSIARETRKMKQSCNIKNLDEYFLIDDDTKINVKNVIYTIIRKIL